MRQAVRAIVTVIATLMPAAGRAQEAVVVPDSVTPQRVFDESNLYNGGSCAACHAIAGRGVGDRAPDLSDIEWLHSEGDFDG
ncbi:MAG: c-type cytochrome, partial [Gemmatimonadota bacterium]